MKNLKFQLMLMLILLTSISTFLSCSNDEVQLNENTQNKNTTSRIATTSCDITGSLIVGTGTYTYTYTSNTNNVNVNWTATPSTGVTISGQGTTTVTITFNSTFNGCTLSAYGTGGNDDCQKTITISKSGGGNGGGDCACPNPVIRCVLAVSGGHPYWRLQLDNLQQGDTFVWSQQHAPFKAGTNLSYVIVDPQGPTYSGFTVYCEVSRRCANGTIKKRKAFYTNYYGGSTTTGTQGYVNNGGVCDSGSGTILD